MPSIDAVSMSGKVVKALPNANFEVELPNKQIITAYLSGKIRKNKITILVGDDVAVELSEYDLRHGRIVFRNTGSRR